MLTETWPLTRYSFKDSGRPFSDWFIFGEDELTCDISNGEQDVIESVPLEIAKKIIEAHNAFTETVKKLNIESISESL